jgi:glycerol-3-phosphate dehydrogenase subunit B
VGIVGSSYWRFPFRELALKLTNTFPGKEGSVGFAPVDIAGVPKLRDCPLQRLTVLLETVSQDNHFLDYLIEALRPHSKNFDIFLFPPIFPETAWRKVASELGVMVAECLPSGEPCAGYRFTQATSAILNANSIPVVRATKLVVQSREKYIDEMKFFRADGSSESIAALSWCLATGKLFGGGIRLGYRDVGESVCNLPVFTTRSSGRVKRRNELDWQSRALDTSQEWARLGVWVDESWRPVDETHRPVFENLRACGSIVGGVDWAASGIGMGFMAYSGRECGI